MKPNFKEINIQSDGFSTIDVKEWAEKIRLNPIG